MRLSKLFGRTIRETPADADSVSHQLLVRAGMISQGAAGVYSYLPLGWRVLRRLEQVIREEMDRVGGQELLMPALQPFELWQASGRYVSFGQSLFTLTDRKDHRLALGPTHEEVVTDLARRFLQSYREMPLMLYQIQTKFRDEMRPRFGIIRAREFLMKDAYSFDVDEKGLDETYARMKQAYNSIFTRSGLTFSIQQADSGVIGGKFSEEFVAKGECPELEVGHLFKLGKQYSEAMKAVFVDRDGKEKPAVMGCYGIGVSRIVAAAVEGNYDDKGIKWPLSIAPFSVLVIPVNVEGGDLMNAAEKIYDGLLADSVEVLMDDRDVSVGVKFSEADLTGIPLWVVVGKKFTAGGKVEIKIRKENRFVEIEPENAGRWITDYIRKSM